MAGKGKLSKVEEHYILTVNKSLEEIASDLGRSVETVKKFHDANAKVEVKEEVVDETSSIPNTTSIYNGPKAGDLMGRHKTNKSDPHERSRATVMTPAASEASDDFRKSVVNGAHRHTDAIHRPRG